MMGRLSRNKRKSYVCLKHCKMAEYVYWNLKKSINALCRLCEALQGVFVAGGETTQMKLKNVLQRPYFQTFFAAKLMKTTQI